MTGNGTQPPAADMAQIIESAKQLGIELDEAEAMQWLAAMAAAEGSEDVVVDERTGVFGHSRRDAGLLPAGSGALPRDRAAGRVRRRPGRGRDGPGAFRLGGAVQDPDLPRRRRLLRAGQHPRRHAGGGLPHPGRHHARKGPQQGQGPTYQLIEVKFGSYPFDIVRGGQHHRRRVAHCLDGRRRSRRARSRASPPTARPRRSVGTMWLPDPGWCKLDWVVADPERQPACQRQQHAGCDLGGAGR